MGTVPVLPGQLHSWQATYNLKPAESAEEAATSASSAEACWPSGSGSQAGGSRSDPPPLPAMVHFIDTQHRSGPSAPAAPVDEGFVDEGFVEERPVSNGGRSRRCRMSWLTLKFEDKKLDATYDAQFDSSCIDADRMYLQLALLLHVTGLIKIWRTGSQLDTCCLGVCIIAYVSALVWQAKAATEYLQWRRIVTCCAMMVATVNSCFLTNVKHTSIVPSWENFAWALLLHGRILGAVGGSFAGMRQQVRALFFIQLVRTMMVLSVNGQLCSSLCISAPASKSYFIGAANGLSEVGQWMTPGATLRTVTTEPDAACRLVLAFTQIWGGSLLLLSITYALEAKARLEFLAKRGLRPTPLPFRSLTHIYLAVAAAWLALSNPVWCFVQFCEAVMSTTTWRFGFPRTY